MNAGATPLQSNELALGAALAWLRERLQRLADRREPAAAGDADELVAVPTLAVLAQRLGLSAFERDVLHGGQPSVAVIGGWCTVERNVL